VTALPTPPPVHDGSAGNLLQRAEPKVKAASLAALLTPLALYYLYRYVPGIAGLPHELDVILATAVTAAATFAAGYAARAVDRVDLVFGSLASKAAAAVTRAGDQTIGAKATDELESYVREIGGKVVGPVKAAVVDAVHAVETAAVSGQDPLAAAEGEAPKVLDSLQEAIADGRAEVAQVAAPALAEVAAAAPALIADVAAAPKSTDELMAELRRMIDQLGDGTPIADASQAAVVAAPAPVAIPAPADPPTAPMAAVTG
jgi:hypothetical protein